VIIRRVSDPVDCPGEWRRDATQWRRGMRKLRAFDTILAPPLQGRGGGWGLSTGAGMEIGPHPHPSPEGEG